MSERRPRVTLRLEGPPGGCESTDRRPIAADSAAGQESSVSNDNPLFRAAVPLSHGMGHGIARLEEDSTDANANATPEPLIAEFFPELNRPFIVQITAIEDAWAATGKTNPSRPLTFER
jgi:hypothetical protein